MAVNQSITKKFAPNFKDVSYLSKNFSEFRQNLIEFARSYYPNTYTDFNEASPGMMFIEMAAYVGDVMSFYIDNQFKENLLAFAQERKNVVAIAQAFGYKPRLAAPATAEALIYQMVPALGATNNYDPDSRYFLRIRENSTFSSNTTPVVTFKSTESVDFADPTDREFRVLSRDVSGAPTMYVASKKIKLVASQTKTLQYTVGSAERFIRIPIPDANVINILSVVDSDGREWTEVDFLGQDVVIEERDVTPRTSDGFLLSGSIAVEETRPAKIAIFKKKPRRFVTRVNENLNMELWFGSGEMNVQEEVLQLNSTQIANDKYDQLIGNTSLDPVDFLSSDAFGLAPSNTTLTVTYAVGGGVESNVQSNSIVVVNGLNVENNVEDFESTPERNLLLQVVNSVAINNQEPARGGGRTETIEEIRQNALAYINAQNRVVTDKDYLVRSLSMPPQFGTVAKAFVVRDEQINNILTQDPNKLTFNQDDNPYNNRTYVEDPVAPNAVNIYVLGYNSSKKLSTLNSLVKQNLSKYLEQFRVLTDEVNILDAFIVNIGVEFDIVVYRNYNLNDVLARCIDAVRDFFDIDKWQINQPIVMNDLRLTIGSVDGVQTVSNVNITNKYNFKDGKDYQEYRYPINEAIVDDIIYPSLDPCVFEIRYPETDIIGNARQ